MMLITILNLDVGIPPNRENQALLEKACTSLLKDYPEHMDFIFLLGNTLHIVPETGTMEKRASYGVVLGARLQEMFKFRLIFDVKYESDTSLILHMKEANDRAHMIYEDYLEDLQLSPGDLFGVAGAIPFENLPMWFRKGVIYKKP